LSIIYLGAVLIFFIFVIMLIDLRFEDLQEVYEEAKMFEPQDLTIFYPIVMLLAMVFLNVLLERILYEEYYGLELFITNQDLNYVPAYNSELLIEYLIENSLSPVSIGFSLFCTEGGSVGILSLILLFSLYASLYTVQTANEEVMLRLEAISIKNAVKKLN